MSAKGSFQIHFTLKVIKEEILNIRKFDIIYIFKFNLRVVIKSKGPNSFSTNHMNKVSRTLPYG